jgi:hypothetical protein
MVRFEKGDEHTVDCSCDSDCMLKIMPQVGDAIRQRYRENGVSDGVEIILVMDNAGGHSKNDVVEKYKQDLLRHYNVRIWHQQPRTPESNMLDLGVWMHVQSTVEAEHFGMRVHRDVLWKTMQDAWWKHMKQQALINVYNQLLKVVALTIEARGCNRLVEKRRGKLMSIPSADEEAFGMCEIWTWMWTSTSMMMPVWSFLGPRVRRMKSGTTWRRISFEEVVVVLNGEW